MKSLEELIEHYGTLADVVRAVPLHNDILSQAKYLSDVAAVLCTINEDWAEAKSLLNEVRAKASEEFISERYSKLSKRLVENLVDGKCGMELRMEVLFERLSRTAVHNAEMVRSLLSNSKSERESARFQR